MKHVEFNSLPWYRKIGRAIFYSLAYALMLPIVVVAIFPFFVAILGYASIVNVIGERRFRTHMLRRGRLVTLRECRDCVHAQRGTLILESPTIGWNISRLWWTADDVATVSPYREPRKEDYERHLKEGHRTPLDWDLWCWRTYVSPETGQAKLVRAWNGWRLEKRLRRGDPTAKVVCTWTGLVDAADRPSSTSSHWPRVLSRMALGCVLAVSVAMLAMLMVAALFAAM